MTIEVQKAVSISADLFRSVGTDLYPEILISSLRSVASFDIFAIVNYPIGQSPIFLYDNFPGLTSPGAMKAYVAGTYLLDPVYTACRSGAMGLRRFSDLTPDNYFESEYYISTDVHPCISSKPGAIAEEIVYIIQYEGGSSLVVSMMRLKSRSYFTNSEFSILADLEPVIRQSAMKQWELPPLDASANKRPGRDASSELEVAFSEFASEALSSREQSIVSFLLRGHSTLSVAMNLSIAEGTVKVHRRHIYEKLNISSQAELFLLFCRHILRNN